jgi:hypothetical protein
MALCLVLCDGGLKLEPREQLQQLGENAGYSFHGGGLLLEAVRSWPNKDTLPERPPPPPLRANLDKPEWRRHSSGQMSPDSPTLDFLIFPPA